LPSGLSGTTATSIDAALAFQVLIQINLVSQLVYVVPQSNTMTNIVTVYFSRILAIGAVMA
jgi:hypothetical protein